MVTVTERLTIPNDDLAVRFVRSGGPGGQNVNKVATKVELRFRLGQCEVLSGAAKRRLVDAYPGYVTNEGDVIVASARYRTQARNRQDAEDKLAQMIRGILRPPKKRRPTKVSRRAKRKRVEAKRKRGEVKRRRKPPRPDGD